MKNPPDLDNQTEQRSERSRSLLSYRTGIAIGAPLLLGLVAGGWWLWTFVNEQLAPLVERNLTQTLNRPVQLGRVESFSPTSLRFGASAIPATATDPDRAAVTAVDVTFNPLQLLITRTLRLDVTLVNPDVYLEQDAEGRWISTTLAAEEGTGPISTELDRIRFRNANVVLVPDPEARNEPIANKTTKASVTVSQGNGFAQFLDNNELIRYNISGNLATEGNIEIQGESQLSTERTNLQIQAQNVLASEVTRLIDLPIDLQGGRVDGNLNVQLRQAQEPALFGTAQLRKVTAQVEQLPQAFNNSSGTLGFQGTQIWLDNVQTSYGSIPAIANGVLDTEAGFNIAARVPTVSFANAQKTLELDLPVPVAGEARAEVQLSGPIQKPTLSGSVRTTKQARIDRVDFKKLSARFAFAPTESVIAFKDIQAVPTVGGQITGGGTLRIGDTPGLGFNLDARNIPGDAIARLYGAAPDFQIGTIQARANVVGSPTQPQTIVNWQAANATYPARGQILIANAQNLLFRNTTVDFAGGTLRAAGQLTNNQWQATVQASGVELGRVAEVPPALQAPISGTFNVAGTTASFQPDQIQATGSGRLNVAGGTVTASNIQLAQGRWQAQVQASGVQLGSLVPQVPPQFQGALTGTFNLAGATTAFQPETIVGTGSGRLNVAGGTVTAANIQLAQGRWQAQVNASQVELARFSEQLQGQLNGQLRVAGTVDSFDLADVRAVGNLRFSQGIGPVQQPLTATIGWVGDRIIVEQATAPNLNANGLILVQTASGVPEVTELDLNVQAQNYSLQDLPFELPAAGNLAGSADFTGNITGTLTAPNVVGALQLQNLAVNDLAFAPQLTGNVQLTATDGLQLDVSGGEDQITLNLDAQNRPVSFLVRRDAAVARGRSVGENLLVNIENFPLAALELTPDLPILGNAPISGQLTGDLTVNPTTFAVAGNIAIADPAIGTLTGNQFVGQVNFADGTGTLTGGEFIQGDGRYAFSGSVTQTPSGPEFEAQVNVANGQVQSVLTALRFFNLEDFQRGLEAPTYAGASTLNTTPVGIPDAPLLTQIRRYSEITTLLQQQRQQRQDASPLPALADFQGTFGGTVAVSGSLQAGVTANFDLQGQNWQWGDYNADQVIAQGNFEDGVLTLLPLRIQSDESLLAFTGQIGGTEQSGQLQVTNFPINTLTDFVDLPIDVTGQLNGSATLAGTVENPQAIGELELSAGTLNNRPVESATASFSYANARFNIGSNIVVTGPEPIVITGSIPLELPFASVTPDSDQISLDINVQNEGLALLNLLTDAVAWESGQGQVQLQVRGTTQEPVATGIATINDATITAQALPEPLTDVTGTINFNLDRIQVDSIQGNFSRGNVVAQGVIPIFSSFSPADPDFANPLTVNLNQLTLNLDGLYRGGASGNVIVTGSVLNPVIGGQVELAQGAISIPEENGNGSTPGTTTPTSASVPNFAANQEGTTNFELNNLQLTLGNGVEVTRPPIINLEATGSLNVSGTLNDLRPNGMIRLRRGGVNLFTTQFVLARGYEHTATFKPNQGLDPELDIRLVTRVPEVTRTRVATSPLSGDITQPLATDLGGFETVRVQAEVQGPASQLFDNLELTSNPSRSQSEIVALLGGSFIDTLGRGDSVLGLANLAGTALLGNFQGAVTNIGNAFGLSELRLFPTVGTESGGRTSALELAAEAGIDVSRNLSVSVLRVLTSDDPTRIGLNYRLNDQFRVRAATDITGETRAILEYENRF
ncbi:protein of unknown function DUF490 [Gloeocapsa sp. PCC 7428]|uniref:translocation/assembly module TamB domain-containing protein n=1 Tax=Gloeocapsa sp. PCC 7428 TaxID=1173026 RepID=UPI0002A6176C|nr:translocation/assembly module TamB [Gloeocapsa sp. PCC 7428]AFZ29093.1 protein of unknown function DUF490 [Gloeocapsa sp. PCC 7428]